MGEAPPAGGDGDQPPASEVAGRLAGRAVTSIGKRLLGFRSVRAAIRRAVEEASDGPGPGPATEQATGERPS